MSYDVYLEDHTAASTCSFGHPERFVPLGCKGGHAPGEFCPEQKEWDGPCSVPCYPTVKVPRFTDGGTYPVGGTTEAELNITYNYGKYYWLCFEGGLRWLHGKQAGVTIERLERAVRLLGTTQDFDYWKPTPGNCGHALNILLGWARLHPNAVWEVH